MRTPRTSSPRPLAISLARFSSAVAVAAALHCSTALRAHAAPVSWDGGGGDFLWPNPLNWTPDGAPAAIDDLTFGTGVPGTIHLINNQTENSLTFTDNFALGAYGTNLVLTNTSGNVTVNPGDFATINASYGGTNGINLSGGGSLYLTNPLSLYSGNIAVDGAGTSLVHRQEGPTVQYNGLNSGQEFGRFDPVTLGYTQATRNITLTNGGEYRIINTGNNPELNHKNIIIGAGGGTLNLAAGYVLQNLDDVGQLAAAAGNPFTKAGPGRLIIGGAMADANPLAGVVNINGGMISLDRLQAGGAAGTRFAGIASAGNTVNVNNGGTLFINNGTQGRLDVATVNLNDGGLLAINGNNHIIGLDAGGTTMNVTGTPTAVVRDLFGAQTARFIFMRTAIAGSGTLNLLGNTANGGTPRLVIERGSDSTFSGVFRLNENVSLEANPRFNPTVHTGKVIADGDVEFAGWGGTIDARDSTAATSVFDYTTNEISITTTQDGAVNAISPGRGDTAAGTGNMFNFGTLTMGSHRLAIAGNNSYQTGFADTASIRGDAVLIMNANAGFAVFSNASAISEDAAGRSLTILKSGVGNTAARDVIVGGAISLSNLQVATGTLQLRGANGAITTGAGGAAPRITINGSGVANNGNTLPTQGLLHLDGSTGHVVGATTVIAAGNNNDRIVDSANVIMRSNSILRLTSASGVGTTETIGTGGGGGGLTVTGHATIDVVKTGTTTSPVALTINNPNPAVTATANFTGTNLGVLGPDSSRIIIPVLPTGFMGAQFHQGNEWAKYDATIDSGFAVGVTPFVAADYTIDSLETTWAAGQQIKQTGTAITLTANRNADRFNFQPTAVSTLSTAGFVLTTDQGGILSSTNVQGFKDGAPLAPISATAGVTAGATPAPAGLFVHANNTVEFHLPIINNLAGGPVTFVKSGTGTVILSHQDRAVNQGQNAAAPFITPTWSSTNTGGWVINDGMLNVHRGQFLGATPTTVTLNGGQLEINEGVSNANADSILPGWGHHIVVNGNAMIGNDDNGESNDANTGDRTLVRLGSLTVNNGSLLGLASFSDNDNAFMGGATFNGRPGLNIGAGGRSGVNNANIINGVIAGTGFDVLALGGNGATLVLGGTQSDTASNTYNGNVTIYGATVRLNKANGSTAITDGAAAEDVIINGGNLFWGPGHHGDLSTTNNINTTNNALAGGIAPTSPAAIKNAGMNQIADTAAITLLTGTLGESDRITNERFGTLIMKNGTFNVGLGTVEIDNAIFSGGALGFDRGGTLKIGNASYLPGAFDQSVFTGRPVPGAYTTLEIGAGGISLTGQNITLGNGFFNNNVAGAGGRLVLGGNLTFNGSHLLGGSFGRKGIYVQTGASFRELGNSHVDLAGGVRDFNIGTDSLYTITAPIRNGGLTKSGGGALILEPYQPSSFAGPITVTAGVLQAKGDGAFGTSAGGVTIGSGGTVKLDSGWTYGDDFTVSGPGALIPGGGLAREVGALIAESGTNRLTGAVILAGDATLAGNTFLDPSVTPGTGGAAFRIGTLLIAGPGGVTGAGNLTLSGPGDGVIVNGVNTVGGVLKDGAGRWTISGPGTYAGPTTISAGQLRITHALALGAPAAGTTVLGGALELAGGITLAEPLTLNGFGNSLQSGALVSLNGANTVSANTTLGSDATIRSDSAGPFSIGNVMAAGATNPGLTLSGSGLGFVTGAITTGPAATLTKNGKGLWNLFAANTFGGATTVNGGVLALDFGLNNGNKLSPTAPLNMAGGSLAVNGNAAAPSTQTVNGFNLIAGAGNIFAETNGGQPVTLALGPITRSAGTTSDFHRPGFGAITTSTGNTNGILGGYATVDDVANWATVSGGNIVPFTAYTLLGPTTTATDNARIASGQTQGGSLTANSLKIEGAGVGLGAGTLTLTSGGLLYSGNGVSGISGTGLVSGPTSGDELILHTAGGILDVNTPLIGAGTGSLTKAGPGTVTLRGVSSFTGSINVNDGTILIPGAPAFPGTLGNSVVGGNRLINLNGGGLGILGDWDINDWDGVTAGIQSLQFNIGPGGGTLATLFGSQLIINDGSATPGVATQLMGSGDLTLTGGGRHTLSGGTPQFIGFTGNTTLESGFLTVGHSNSLGGRQEQTITLKAGSAIINNTGFGLGQNGLPNNIVAESGVEFYGVGGSRAFGGDLQLSGTSTIALMERDNAASERQLFFNGRVTGAAVTMNVFGVVNNTPFYLASGSNPFTGTINLNANAVLETRMPGSLGLNAGDVSINLQGANSRLLLRSFQNGDFRANVNVTDTSEINSDRLVNYGGGASQLLTINNLNVNAGTDRILTFTGGNGYTTRVAGTATFNSNTIINTPTNVLFENGINFTGGANLLDKRSGGSVILRGPSNHSGPTIVQGGFLILQGGGTLPNTSSIDLRGGELRVDNSDVTNPNRLNDAARVTLGGGILRITGDETLGPVSAVAGTTQVINNPINETVPNPLTLTAFSRATGAVVQFQSPDSGGGALAVGQNTVNQTRVGSRILIPGQADTTQTIPGFLGNNGIDFIQYDGTTVDSGFPLGVRDMRNPGNVQSPANYTNDAAETAWNDTIILRRTNPTDNTIVTDTLTASRALDAIKVETGGTNRDYTIALGANNLRIEGGGIIVVGNTTADFTVTGTTGVLTAGPAVPGAGTAELILGGNGNAANGTANINAIIADNGTQPVALVKTGVGVLNLNGTAPNTYTGGTFVTAGTLNTTVNSAFGAATNPITLSGGILQFNIANAGPDVALGGLGQNISVVTNSAIIMDNGTAGLDNNLAFGNLTISGGTTLAIRGFDSVDVAFTGTHAFSGTPTIDLNQAGSGSNPNTPATASVVTLGGPITGSGFFVNSSGNTNDTAARLQIGGGATDTAANTYTGKVTILQASNTEDTFVELNKAPGTTAITGDLQLDGGNLVHNFDDQIADTSNIVNNRSILNFNGKNETIASLTMNGGGTITNATTGTPAPNTVSITGPVIVNGYDDFGGVTTGLTVGNNSTLNVGGLLTIGAFGRVHLAEGQTAGVLNVNGGLEMTSGAVLNQSSGAGPNIVRLNGNVTTFGGPSPVNLGNSGDSDTFLELNGTRTFTVADGGAGIDLSISTVMRDSTAPVAVGSFVKTGPGVVQIQGGGTANSYTGPTVLNEGTLVLFKNAGVDSLGSGAATNTLTIGDGIGGAKADKIIVRNSDQIANATAVTIASSGLLDLQTFNTNETVASISGSGNIDLGPSSVLTTGDGNDTTFGGSIQGAGGVTKQGSGSVTFSGNSDYAGITNVNAGELLVTGVIDGSTVVVNTGGTLGGTGSVEDITVGSGGTLAPGITVGDLTAKGDTSFTPSSIFALELNGPVPGTQHDQLTVGPNGTISITGGDVTLALGYTPAPTQAFTVIDNLGSSLINGTFANLPQGGVISASFNNVTYDFVANYNGGTGNDLVLTVPEPTSGMIALAGLCLTAGLRRFRRQSRA